MPIFTHVSTLLGRSSDDPWQAAKATSPGIGLVGWIRMLQSYGASENVGAPGRDRLHELLFPQVGHGAADRGPS